MTGNGERRNCAEEGNPARSSVQKADAEGRNSQDKCTTASGEENLARGGGAFMERRERSRQDCLGEMEDGACGTGWESSRTVDESTGKSS